MAAMAIQPSAVWYTVKRGFVVASGAKRSIRAPMLAAMPNGLQLEPQERLGLRRADHAALPGDAPLEQARHRPRRQVGAVRMSLIEPGG